MEVQGDEYDAWNSDDYIEDLILSKLEMVKIVEPEPVVEVVPEVTPEVVPDVTPEVTPDPSTGTASEPSSEPNIGV